MSAVSAPLSAVIALAICGGACGSTHGSSGDERPDGSIALDDAGADAVSNDATDDGGIDGGIDAGSDAGSDGGVDPGNPAAWTASTCAALTFHPAVPMTPTSMLASGTTTYAFLSTTHWMRISAGTGTTEPIALPPGRSSMDVRQVEVEPNGRNLVRFKDGANQYASFFTSGTFDAPIALPATTASIHADGAGRLVLVDTDRFLWKHNGTTFENYGALPVPANNQYAWAVDSGGTVHVAYVNQGSYSMFVSRRGPSSQTWTTGTNLTPTYQVGLSWPSLVAGRDGSVHLAYYATFTNGIYPSYNYVYYARSADGIAWSDHEKLRTSVSGDTNPTISPVLVHFSARTYDGAQATLYSNGNVQARRCGPSNLQGWPATMVAPYGGAMPMAAVNEVGVPSIWVKRQTGADVLQRM